MALTGPVSTLVESTEAAIAGADWLTDADRGAVQALRSLAQRIQDWDEVFDRVLEMTGPDERVPLPQNDNTSLPTYLKYCEQLGLTPLGRKALAMKREAESGKSAKLTALRVGAQATKPTAARRTAARA